VVLSSTSSGASDDVSAANAEFLVPTEVRRIALVVGVGDYPGLGGKVPNADRDAERVAQALSTLHFTTVHHLRSPTRDDLNLFVNQVALSVASDPAIVVFFFAGHGFQHDAGNYLVPQDATKANYLVKSFPITNILATIVSDRPGMTVLLLDACRTNALQADAIGTSGFAAVGSTDNAILSFASQFGTPAKSMAAPGQENSPYTLGVLKYINIRGISLDDMLQNVRTEVRDLTDRTQSPQYISGAAGSAFAFLPAETQTTMERDHWREVLKSYDPRCVRRYIENHPGSSYLAAATRWLAAPPAAPAGGGVPCVERHR
jgi:uncharacterized caspase-like protein